MDAATLSRGAGRVSWRPLRGFWRASLAHDEEGFGRANSNITLARKQKKNEIYFQKHCSRASLLQSTACHSGRTFTILRHSNEVTGDGKQRAVAKSAQG